MNAEETLVTVYMPSRNRVELLRRALETVLTQSHRHLEIIVVDDGSIDATPDFLLALSQRDDRVRFIRNDISGGAPAARNAAIRAARGEFLTGLDDDDSFLPGRISTLLAYWRLLEAAGERPALLYTQEIGVVGGVRTPSKRMGSASYLDMFQGNHVGNQIFAPRKHYLEAGLFDERLAAWQDLEFFMRVLQKFGEGRLLDLPTYEFDNTPRNDRISVGSYQKVRAAFQRVAEVHAPNGGRPAQALLLQMFGGYYQHVPKVADWQLFLRQGLWIEGALKMLKAYPRRWRARLKRV
jgi:glycosyltransferase involved in cell wall biosynthesis